MAERWGAQRSSATMRLSVQDLAAVSASGAVPGALRARLSISADVCLFLSHRTLHHQN
jgi:hypothetical protein